ncbi:glycosyltransferase [Lapillicoccus jejuensis]|uniref:Glycosyltransferase involved in cell wall biosynthesis n=1 Tax=Lapillicoccus jejuensis TaxID=402171 RepID=A0A542DWW7_9MICO|nr:glycosyltransferase [Lapillicoccus jejuensis]TQJ07573.1 glycosyltransferase involved in cell wall biosynthesis [Lapillicoccus jejuensis]
MLIAGFGTYDRDRHPRTGIVLDGFRDLGDEVVELDRPLGFSTAERVEMLGKPWLAHRLATRLVRRWAQLTGDRLRLRGRRPDAVVVGYLGHFDVVLARLLFPRTTVVLDLLIFAADTASDRGVRPSAKLRLLGVLDRLAVRCSDVVLVDTQEHAVMLTPTERRKGVVVPVGAPDAWFAPEPPPAGGADGPLRVLFYGLFTPLQGAPVIGRALALLAARGADVQVTMVGGGQDLERTRELAGPDNPLVTWHEWVEPDRLPVLAREQDVCLGIFADSGKGLRVTPNKVYQGAAAGCAVVTSRTPPQERALGDDALLVAPGDADALAEALGSLAADRARVLELRRRAWARADRDFRPARVAAAVRPALTRP